LRLSLFSFLLSPFASGASGASALADLPAPIPAAAETGSWLSVAAFCLAIAVAIKTLWPARRQPPIEAEFLTRADFKAHEERDAKEFAEIRRNYQEAERRWLEKIEEVRQDINLHGERRAVALHERLNAIATQVARQDGIIHTQHTPHP